MLATPHDAATWCANWSGCIDREFFETRTVAAPKAAQGCSQQETSSSKGFILLTRGFYEVCSLEARRDRKYVFGIGEVGYSGWSKAKEALDAKLKQLWTLHDIRRTVRTNLGALGIEPHISEAVINHLPPKLVRTFDINTYLKEKRAAWASELDVRLEN